MYSHEIEELLRSRNYRLSRSESNEINPRTCPQIVRMTYDTSQNKFFVYTDDGYNFEYEVYVD